MFVTLKASKNARKGAGMEQVSLSSARQDSARNRFGSSRRDACMACRSKKVRCTGLMKACDRCIAQQVACVFSSEPRARTRKSRAAGISSLRRPRLDASIQDSLGNRDNDPQAQSSAENDPGNTTQNPGQELVLSEGLPQGHGHLPNMNQLVDQDSYLSLVMAESSQIEPLDMAQTPAASSETSARSLSSNLPQSGSTPNSVISPPSIPGDYQESFMTDGSPSSFDGAFSSDRSTIDSPVPGLHPAPDTPNLTTCTCIDDILGIVQKLDNDEFKLRTLGFDLVLKLQKWMVFHCCKPLDCPKCLHLPTASTVILIICNRIANMFQCLSRRIGRQLLLSNEIGDESSNVSNNGTPVDTPLTSDLAITINASVVQLVDGTTISAPCNPDMFSPEFECQYSKEERLHMIRVLTKLQVRNFNQLLLRISEIPQSQNSQARVEKVAELMNRLQHAAASIDDTFGKMIENLVS